MKEIKIGTGQYAFGIPEESGEKMQILDKLNKLDITEEIMQPESRDVRDARIRAVMADAAIEINYLVDRAEKAEQAVKSAVEKPAVMNTVLGEMPVDADTVRKLNDKVIELSRSLALINCP